MADKLFTRATFETGVEWLSSVADVSALAGKQAKAWRSVNGGKDAAATSAARCCT